MTGQTVSWDQKKLEVLKKAYAENKQAASFKITVKPEGELEFVPGYAKYLIEYLEGEFAKAPSPPPPGNEGEQSYTPGSGSWEN